MEEMENELHLLVKIFFCFFKKTYLTMKVVHERTKIQTSPDM